MKGFLAGVALGFKTFVKNPLGYLTNPIKATEAQYVADLEKAGAGTAEISDRVEDYRSSGGIVYDAYKGLGDLGRFLKGTASLVLRNLPLLFVLGLVLIALYYAWPLLAGRRILR